jgi:hypothetical protein
VWEGDNGRRMEDARPERAAPLTGASSHDHDLATSLAHVNEISSRWRSADSSSAGSERD